MSSKKTVKRVQHIKRITRKILGKASSPHSITKKTDFIEKFVNTHFIDVLNELKTIGRDTERKHVFSHLSETKKSFLKKKVIKQTFQHFIIENHSHTNRENILANMRKILIDWYSTTTRTPH